MNDIGHEAGDSPDASGTSPDASGTSPDDGPAPRNTDTVADEGLAVEGRADENLAYERIGRFTVLRKLGEGGMGIVYAAFDEQLDRKVAIKLLHSRGKPASTGHARMIREARAMARLSHPNVVQVHEVGEIDGRIFVAMEYVRGETLGRWLERSPRSCREILGVFMQAGQGLAAAHDAGIIHRDFKPDNVIVGRDGRVKVLDFGLARWEEPLPRRPGAEHSLDPERPSRPPPSSLTRTGALMGTPFYMSPEQFRRQSVDMRSDQFSFCVALYEALYGVRPFEGDTYHALIFNVVGGHVRSARPRVPLPRHLPDLLLRGLSVDPAERFSSMGALLVGLQDFQSRVDALNNRMLRLQTTLGSGLVLAFWVLDWLFMPQHAWVTLGIRVGICVVGTVAYVLSRFATRWAERHIDVLAFAVNLAAGWGLVAIVWLEGGVQSHYYAGLNLLVLCVGIMFLWSVRRTVVLTAMIYLFYLSPLVLDFLPVGNRDVIIANQFFLVSTIILTIAAQRQRFTLQRRQFVADQERRLLREQVNAIVEARSAISQAR